MFPRIVTSRKKNSTYKYLVISESIRKKGKSTTRDIASFGNIARFAKHDVEAIIDGLIKIFKLEKYSLSKEVEIVESLEYGSVIFWKKLWNELNLSDLIRHQLDLRRKSVQFAVEKYIEMMTVSRCIEPNSKLGMTRWLETTCYKEMKGYGGCALSYDVNYFYRSMDYLLDMKDSLELAIFEQLRNLFSVNIKLTFYDITSTFFYGDNCSMSAHGYSRDHRPEREQIVIGVVTSYEGYPIKHFVFEGNTADNSTVEEVVSALKKDYHINETIFVGDRGMVTRLNMKHIEDNGYDYIMGVKMRNNQLCQMLFTREAIDWSGEDVVNYRQLKIVERVVWVKEYLLWKSKDILEKHDIFVSSQMLNNYAEWINLLTNGIEPDYKDLRRLLKALLSQSPMASALCGKIVTLIKRYGKRYEDKFRFIICLNSQRQQAARKKREAELKAYSEVLDKLFAGACNTEINETVEREKENILKSEAAINSIFKDYRFKYRKYFNFERNKKTKLLTGYSLNQERVDFEEKLDGVFTLLANRDDLDAEKIVASYKNLKEVETLFDDLKNFVDIRPIRHWLGKRVRSHVFICILALLLKRIFEINYLGGKEVTEPLEQINKAKLIKYKVKFSEREERHQIIPKVTDISAEQKKYFNMIGIKNPSNLEPFLW